MAIEIRVPALGESVTEAIVGKWFKKAGETVKADEPLVELETDKVTLEVNAPSAGFISEIRVKEGETVAVGAVLGAIGEGAGASPPRRSPTRPLARKSRRRSPMVASHLKPSRARPTRRSRWPPNRQAIARRSPRRCARP